MSSPQAAACLAWRRNFAEGQPFRWLDLAGILLWIVFARSTAMAFNRLVDRNLDADNPRTAGRHLPRGLLSVPAVVAFSLLSAGAFVASTLLFLPNRWPAMLSIPVLLFLLGYSYAKRFTVWCHYWLSAALMLSPIAAWIAIRGEAAATPVLLSTVIFFWVGGFDILYACQDVDFDRGHGLRSIPARFGVATAIRLSRLMHVGAILAMVALWKGADLPSLYLAGVAIVAVLLFYEQSLVSDTDLSQVKKAFDLNGWVGIVYFATTALALYVG